MVRYAGDPDPRAAGPDPVRTRLTLDGIADMRKHLRKLRPSRPDGGRAVRVLHYPYMPFKLRQSLGRPYAFAFMEGGGLETAYMQPKNGYKGVSKPQMRGCATEGDGVGEELLEEAQGTMEALGLQEWAVVVPRKDAVALMGVTADVELTAT